VIAGRGDEVAVGGGVTGVGAALAVATGVGVGLAVAVGLGGGVGVGLGGGVGGDVGGGVGSLKRKLARATSVPVEQLTVTVIVTS